MSNDLTPATVSVQPIPPREEIAEITVRGSFDWQFWVGLGLVGLAAIALTGALDDARRYG